ncbi:MAG: trehalose-6-phosphate synthase [Pararhodobacter sp.]|nr:trehalose-6-phosphate synthase [Pararhodobacter sp.]
MSVQSSQLHGGAFVTVRRDGAEVPVSSLQGSVEDPSSDSGGEEGQQRLIVVSNRVADLRASAQSGGLAVGLSDAMRRRGGIWFGWNGKREGETGGPVEVRQFGRITCVGAPVSPKDFADYYLGYANSVLWPLFHYRLDLVNFNSAGFEAYMRVNEAFARRLMPMLKPNDIIWVHDYHLIPLACYLRKLGCKQRIGHFLHIPFPPPDLLSATPNHRALVDAMLDYDLLGFQTHTDVANLKTYLRTQETDAGTPGTGHRSVQIDRFPIGINVGAFAELARKDGGDPTAAGEPEGEPEPQRIIAVDRLDYSKGLPQRFRAFDTLLSNYPQLKKKVGYLQIAPPTRAEVDAYADIRAELEGLAGSVNGRFADLDWTPIQFLCRSLPRSQLAPLMRNSDVGFVTPLRDGMNLVAKEYVAAQSADDPGVLVLSEFAGAAEEMQEALIVNPYDTDDMAAQLYRALSMPLDERRERHAALLERITTHDSQAWLESYLAALTKDHSPDAMPLKTGDLPV